MISNMNMKWRKYVIVLQIKRIPFFLQVPGYVGLVEICFENTNFCNQEFEGLRRECEKLKMMKVHISYL